MGDEDQAALRAVAARPGTALCTIVRIDGSFSRRLGAQLAVAPDGTTVGSLSDGCLERELATVARESAGAEARTLRYGQGSPFIDFRLPCGSGLDILVDPAPDPAAVAATVAALDRRESAELLLPDAPEGMLRRRAYLPALEIAIHGTGPEAAMLRQLARALGIACVATITPDKLDRWTAAVVLLHDHEEEPDILRAALASPAFYIGAMGGALAREQRQARLAAEGMAAAQIARVRSPIGLIGHAREPGMLALSVLAEIAGAYDELRAPC